MYQIIQVILSVNLINLSVQSIHRDLNTTYRGFEASEIGYTKGNMYSKIVVEIKLIGPEFIEVISFQSLCPDIFILYYGQITGWIGDLDRKSTRQNSSHVASSYAVF